MTEPLDIPCIIRLLRNCERPVSHDALMQDAASALQRMEIAIKAFLREYDKAEADDTHTMRLGELAQIMREAL